MISALPASYPWFGNPFSAFDGSYTSSDCSDFFSSLKATKPKPVTSRSRCSDDPNRPHAKVKPASDDTNRGASVMDERKRRRMISNRESARRSRMRKQRHVENLRNQLNQYRIENRELNNRLQFLLHHCNRIRTENNWLLSERTVLLQKLSHISQISVFQQLQPFSSAWPCSSTLTAD